MLRRIDWVLPDRIDQNGAALMNDYNFKEKAGWAHKIPPGSENDA